MKDYIKFLDIFFNKTKAFNFNLSNLKLDHIAYYTSSKEEYDKIKPEFEKLGNFYHEALIGDRRVGVSKLIKPIKRRNYEIEALELIEPKENEIHKSDWEHAEFVINENYKEFMDKYPNIEWETKSMDRPIYSHITVSLDKDTKIKFHNKSILECVELDKE